jgi:ssDNA-binding Zn-finger/Zn-ribbon topoisomerase 1
MGSGYELQCDSCNHTMNVNLGVGMFEFGIWERYRTTIKEKGKNPEEYDPDDSFLTQYFKSKRIREEISKFFANGAVIDTLGNELYECVKCNTVANRFHLKLKTKDEPYEPDHRCPKCKSSLNRVTYQGCGDDDEYDERSEIPVGEDFGTSWKCAKCGKGKLVMLLSMCLYD